MPNHSLQPAPEHPDVIDLRSDTKTLPTERMLQAIRAGGGVRPWNW